jgi:hypothetical protein
VCVRFLKKNNKIEFVVWGDNDDQKAKREGSLISKESDRGERERGW